MEKLAPGGSANRCHAGKSFLRHTARDFPSLAVSRLDASRFETCESPMRSTGHSWRFSHLPSRVENIRFV